MREVRDPSLLIELARSRSEKSRRELVSRIADTFAEEDWTERESLLFSDILTVLISAADAATRAEVADQISDCESATDDLHKRLAADDDPTVADPVLQRSNKLDEGFLTEIATRGSDRHRLAISQRKTLGQALCEVLVALGDIEVKRQVAGNRGASLSPRARSILLRNAETDESVRAAISERVGPALQMLEALRRGEASPCPMRQPSEAEPPTPPGELDRHRQRIAVKQRLERIVQDREPPDAFLIELARGDRIADLTFALSHLTGIAERAVSTCLLSINVEPTASICRVLSLEETTVTEIARLRGRRLRLPESMAVHTLLIWRQTDRSKAQQTLDSAAPDSRR